MTDRSARILVVDDNRMNRLKLTRAAAAGGYEVSEADGGRAALEKLRAEAFDLVLLDIMMPEIDGFQVLNEMKGDAALSDVPVIIISGLEDMESVDRCMAAGAVDFLNKSVGTADLQDRISQALDKSTA